MQAIIPKLQPFVKVLCRQPVDLWIVLACHVIAYSMYYLALGLKFDASVMTYNMQFLEPGILRDHLLRSISNLHSQPPLMNIYLGIILKLWPNHFVLAFQLSYFFVGLAAIACLFLTMAKLGVSRLPRITLCLLTGIFPTFFIYQAWIYTAHFEFCLCAISLYFLSGFCMEEKKRLTWAYLFFFICTLLGLIRAQWHIAVFIGIALLMSYSTRALWRNILLTALIGLLPLAAWYSKNAIVFGFWGASSWAGANLSQAVSKIISPQERSEMADSGIIQPYPSEFNINRILLRQPPETLITQDTPPELRPYKRGKTFNFNYMGIIATAREDWRDSWNIIAAYPERYLDIILHKMWSNASRPSLAYRVVGFGDLANIKAIGAYNALPTKLKLFFEKCAFLLYAVVPVTMAAYLLASFIANKPYDAQKRLFAVCTLFLIASMHSISFMFNEWEQERMRWGIAPGYLCLAAIVMEQLLNAGRTAIHFVKVEKN